MEAYTSFAQVYDMFMDNIPYEEWCEKVSKILKIYGIEEGLIAELGCGTGSMTELLSQKGYDMIGIDYSEEMLEIAMEKREISGESILYLCQDMREFELYGTVKAVVSVCDSINYLLEEENLLETFRLVNNYLDPQGIFVFDFNTIYKYREMLGENTIAENREEGSFIWENYFDEETKINQYDLTLYIKNGDDLYRRFEETHYQRAYEIETIKELILEAGLEFLGMQDVETGLEPTETTERIYVIARERGK